MNLIEERIRAAARAAADTVTPDSVPSLELPAPRARRLGRRRGNARSPGATWTLWAARLAPLAAALAVSGILIAVVILSPPAYQGGPSAGPATTARPDVPPGPPASSYVRTGQVPEYYIAITSSGAAAVRRTASGATVAAIKPSTPDQAVTVVTAAGDNRTFVLGEEGQDSGISFYQVRLGSSGRPGAPARLPVSVQVASTITGLALSPDGTRLAIAIQPRNGVSQVTLYPVHGGPVRTWSATGGAIRGDISTRSLSWAADQRTLAFDWSAGPIPIDGVRLLDTGSGGGSLLAASHPAVSVSNSAGPGQTLYRCTMGMIITPDGSAVICPDDTIVKIAQDGSETHSSGFPEFSTATGRVTRMVGRWAQDQPGDAAVENVLWSDASGRVLIGIVSLGGGHRVGIISGNTFTPLNDRWPQLGYIFGAW